MRRTLIRSAGTKRFVDGIADINAQRDEEIEADHTRLFSGKAYPWSKADILLNDTWSNVTQMLPCADALAR